MAEKLAFNQFGRDGRAVYLYIGHCAAVALLMQAPGHQFLSGAVGAGDQHPGIGGGHLRDDVADLLQGSGRTHHLLAVNLFLEDLVVLHQRGALGRVLDRNKYAVQVERLGYVVECTALDAVDGGFQVTVAGNHHHGGIDTLLPHVVQHFVAVLDGHLDIAENHVIMLLGQHLDAGCAILRQIHVITLVGEDFLE